MLEHIIFAARRLRHGWTRRRLAGRGGSDPVSRAQSTAWPAGRRLRGTWHCERFVVFDTETTGLDRREDHAVSLGAVSFTGGRIDSHGDHRIAMAFAMAALRAGADIRISDCENVSTSFPGFVELAKSAGLGIEGHS